MEENVKNLWLDKIKSGKVAVIESHYAPKNNTNCIWLKDGQMYIYGNTGWEPLGSGSGSGGGVIKLPVKFDTIEVIGGGDAPDNPIIANVNPTRGNTKANLPRYYCKQKVSGDLFGPTENGLVLDIAYYYAGGGEKGGDLRATKSGLDDISHQYFPFQEGYLKEKTKTSQMELEMLGLNDDPSAKVLAYWYTGDSNNQGPRVLSLIYKSSNYLYVVDMNNAGLAFFYNNPDFRGITIMEAEEQSGPTPVEPE